MNRRKISRIVGMVSIIVLICINIKAQAITSTTSVNIIGVRQNRSNWCWAACAEMAGKTAFSASQRTQDDVVNFLMGTEENPTPNEPGFADEVASGANYVAHFQKTFVSEESALDFSEITYSLAKGYAIPAGYVFYNSSGEPRGGHMVTIYMTQFVDFGGTSEYRITYYDPWDGTSHTCAFEDFCDGTYTSGIYEASVYVVGSIR